MRLCVVVVERVTIYLCDRSGRLCVVRVWLCVFARVSCVALSTAFLPMFTEPEQLSFLWRVAKSHSTEVAWHRGLRERQGHYARDMRLVGRSAHALCGAACALCAHNAVHTAVRNGGALCGVAHASRWTDYEARTCVARLNRITRP